MYVKVQKAVTDTSKVVHTKLPPSPRSAIATASCIKAAAYVQLFNFLVQLLFKCGFSLRATYNKYAKS